MARSHSIHGPPAETDTEYIAKVTRVGALQVYSKHGFSDVVDGDVSGSYAVNKFGRNPDIDTTSDPETVWFTGGLYPWAQVATAVSVEVVAGADDDVGGTGMLTISVQGLDANWDMQTAIVTLTGATPAAVGGTWLRIFRVAGQTAGTGLTNADNIVVRIAGAGATLLTVAAGAGQSEIAVYTVPAGKQGRIVSWEVNITAGGASAEVEMALLTRENDIAGRPFRKRDVIGLSNSGSSSVGREFLAPIIVPEKTDIEVRIVNTTASNVGVTAFFLIIVENTP